MKKISFVSLGILALALFFVSSPVFATSTPLNWNVTGSYVFTFSSSSDWAHGVSLSQDGSSLTGSGQYTATGTPQTGTQDRITRTQSLAGWHHQGSRHAQRGDGGLAGNRGPLAGPRERASRCRGHGPQR